MEKLSLYSKFGMLSVSRRSRAVLSVRSQFWTFSETAWKYPAASLKETIPDFHNTVKRFENFEIALKRDIRAAL